MTIVCPVNPKHTKVFRQTGSGDIACLDCQQAFEAQPVKKRANKFNAVKVMTRLGRVDSKKEGRRLEALYNMALAGEIKDLVAHPVYELKAWSPNGPVVIGKYTPDAQYREGNKLIAEDVKSAPTKRTADYRLRKKMFEANYPHILFREV